MPNPIKDKIQSRQPSFGVGMLWPSPELVELFGALGFEWLWLDLEHGSFDLQALSNVVRAADATGMVTVGRLPKTRDAATLLRFAETGLRGVITPHVHTREDVEWVIDALRYAPRGSRSAGMMRASGWGFGSTSAAFYEEVNDQLLILALVEDVAGLEHIDEILKIDELDGVVIGFGDLSLELGRPGQKAHPELLALGDAAWRKVVESGKVLQVTAQTVDDVQRGLDAGALMLRCSAHAVIGGAAKGWLDGARAAAQPS